ncbi:MAG: hypothetical protein [Cressdnaviricota sp.]|nr:MAG: hypothetical protein [Cressdnaviricota sp.]
MLFFNSILYYILRLLFLNFIETSTRFLCNSCTDAFGSRTKWTREFSWSCHLYSMFRFYFKVVFNGMLSLFQTLSLKRHMNMEF